MPVVGYNMIPDPDENNADPIMIDIIAPEKGDTATFTIGREHSTATETVDLQIDGLIAIQDLVYDAIKKIRWNTAQWVYAWSSIRKTVHLQRKGEHGERERAVCGETAPQFMTWNLTPMHGQFATSSLCKKCVAIKAKEQRLAPKEGAAHEA